MRFHHRLVAIHPFPNGNGRHARLMADLLVMRSGAGAVFLGEGQSARRRRRAPDAISPRCKAADNHDIGPLLAFARS